MPKRPAPKRNRPKRKRGAPKGNLNALKSGKRSKQLKKLIVTLMADPETRRLLITMRSMDLRRLAKLQTAINHYANLLRKTSSARTIRSAAVPPNLLPPHLRHLAAPTAANDDDADDNPGERDNSGERDDAPQRHSIPETGPAPNLANADSPKTTTTHVSSSTHGPRPSTLESPPSTLDPRPSTPIHPTRYNASVARIILFDVDQTLLYTGGAGSLAMRKAFHQLHGIADAFGHIEFSGLTDWAILKSGMLQHGVLDGNDDGFGEHMREFQQAYYPLVEPSLHEVEGGHVKPGVPALLAALAERTGRAGQDDIRLGLATGNFREACFIKLRHFELDAHLTEGGFGDDAEDRGELVGIAIQRVANGTVADPDAGAVANPSDVWVIGDTVRDVTAAQANDARSLAVATGDTSEAELREAGATIVMPDLSDTEFVLQVLLG